MGKEVFYQLFSTLSAFINPLISDSWYNETIQG